MTQTDIERIRRVHGEWQGNPYVAALCEYALRLKIELALSRSQQDILTEELRRRPMRTMPIASIWRKG